MKKIIFKMMTALFVLALITVSCQPEVVEPNNPDRTPAPMPASMVIVEQTDSTVLFSATAEGATQFLWQRGGAAIGGQTANTFYLTATGSFPDTARIRVAGVNPSGTGLFADEQTIGFSPWRVPSKATLEGESNVCPTPFIALTANAIPATHFIWYVDGSVLDTTTVPARNVRFSGTVTVRGINALGEGEMSDPVTIAFTECDPFIVADIWSAEPGWSSTGVAEWRDTFAVSSDDPSTFLGGNFMNQGLPIAIRENNYGEWFFPTNEIVGFMDDGREIVQFLGFWNTAWALVLLSDPTLEIPVDISADHSTFTSPHVPVTTFPNQNSTATELAISIRVRNAGETGIGTSAFGTADDIVFTRVVSASGVPVAPQRTKSALQLPSILRYEVTDIRRSAR